MDNTQALDTAKKDEYYRGKYLIDDSWSSDRTKNYFEGLAIRHGYPILKMVLMAFFYITITSYGGLGNKIALLICVVIVFCY